MKKTVKRAAVVYVLIAFFLVGVVILTAQFIMHGSDWATNKVNGHIYSNGTVVNAGTISDRNGRILAESKNNKRIFINTSQTMRKAILHIVGDTSGVISTGTHNLYRSNLSGYNVMDGILNLKRNGTGSGIQLNIDCEANRIAYDALGNYNGTLIVCNYKTGELLCSVSKPAYDVNYVPRDLRTNPAYDGVFLDKSVSGQYTPGSIMKIITAASAIENIPDIDSRTFECTGEYQTGDGKVICNGVHGKINFRQALNQSCNCAFAQISIELGADKLLETAKSLGFNRHLKAKEVPLTMSRFHPSKETKTELGWAGIGQSTTYINPTHFLAIMNAIANGGTGYSPDRIATMGILGDVVGRMPETLVKMNPATAAKLKAMLRSNVVDKYGDWNFPGLEMCGKTGTAEIDGKKSTSVFAGFSSKDSLPLAVVCIAEEAGWGSGTAMKASNTVLQYFLKNYE
jgi:peptidoglycan glycosyltransferase